MAAELRLHERTEDITEEVLRAFFSNTLGSPYFGSRSSMDDMEAMNIIAEAPSVTVGAVSNLKSAVSGDRDKYVPGPAQKINQEIGSEPVEVNDELMESLCEAPWVDNDSIYDDPDVGEVLTWLDERRGEEVFAVSW